MSQAVRQAQQEPLQLYISVNRKVREKYRYVAGVDPSTNPTIDEGADTFSVNIETKEIRVPGWAVMRIPRAPEGFMAHENMHVVFIPGSQERDAAMTAAVASVMRRKGVPPIPGVLRALTNTVMDIIGDFSAALYGVSEIGRRFRDYVEAVIRSNGTPVTDPGIFYKTVQIYLVKSARGKFSYLKIGHGDVEKAVEKMAELYGVPRGSDEYKALMRMSMEMYNVLRDWEGDMDSVLTSNRLLMIFTERVAEVLLDYYKDLASWSTTPQKSTSCSNPVAALILAARDPHATRIVYSNFLPALRVLAELPPEIVEPYVELRWAGLWRFLDRLLRRLLVHVGVPRPSPAASIRTSVPFYENPEGDIDIESVAARKVKPTEPLLTEYDIRLRRRKGLRYLTKAVPEHVVLVIDESGSTDLRLSDDPPVTIKLAEALVGLGVVYGLRRLGGAKRATVVKFADKVKVTYSGSTSNMKRVVSEILGRPRSIGFGTRIEKAVDKGIEETGRNDALAIITDAEIEPFQAQYINQRFREATRSGSVGFLVFMVLNRDVGEIRGILDTVSEGLPRDRSLVAVVSDMREFKRAMQNLGRKMQLAYARGAGGR